MIDVPDSPVFAELQRQISEDPDVVNATALWQAAGRPRNKSPRRRYGKGDEILEDRGGGPDGAVLVSHETALEYAQVLDRRVMDACYEEWRRRLRADPARQMLGCPDPLMALFAVPAVMQAEGVGQAGAKAGLVSEAIVRTSDLDPLEQETEVARVQRALRGEPDPGEPSRRRRAPS